MTAYPTRAGYAVGFTATQEKAAHRLAPLLSTMVGAYVDPYDLHLSPARGRWTHNTADVQRWTGHFKRPDLPKLNYTIGSWDVTLSQIASGCRFLLEDDRGTHWRIRSNDFQVSRPEDRQ